MSGMVLIISHGVNTGLNLVATIIGFIIDLVPVVL